MSLPTDQLLSLYRTMKLIRRFEETVSRLFKAGKIPGFVHLCIGQEATAVGVCSNLRKDDYITSTHRGHGHIIAKGAQVSKVLAELMGKSTGYCKGKGGSMHVADIGIGILGANGIVGGGLPIGVGSGLSAKLRQTDQVTVCFFGEGATSSGYFHEAINMSAILKLPILFFCENNGYVEFTPIEKHVPTATVAERACAYGIQGLQVDGNDVVEVYLAVREAIDSLRRGGPPILMEARTYRWHGHYEGDRATYRSLDEFRYWAEEKDPINLLKMRLTGHESELEALDVEIEQEIANAIQFAEDSPLPDPMETLQDIYV